MNAADIRLVVFDCDGAVVDGEPVQSAVPRAGPP
jgi:beta-phosphoglucomutase-like phosphatase (HAD superfamily)